MLVYSGTTAWGRWPPDAGSSFWSSFPSSTLNGPTNSPLIIPLIIIPPPCCTHFSQTGVRCRSAIQPRAQPSSVTLISSVHNTFERSIFMYFFAHSRLLFNGGWFSAFLTSPIMQSTLHLVLLQSIWTCNIIMYTMSFDLWICVSVKLF